MCPVYNHGKIYDKLLAGGSNNIDVPFKACLTVYMDGSLCFVLYALPCLIFLDYQLQYKARILHSYKVISLSTFMTGAIATRLLIVVLLTPRFRWQYIK